jgi:AraC-like DNA-binding protein
MSKVTLSSKSNTFFSCSDKEHRSVEANIAEHVLIHIYSGSLSVTDSNGAHLINGGGTALLCKNMLAKFIKYPSKAGMFKSVAIAFTRPFLLGYYAENKSIQQSTPHWGVHKINEHPLLTSLFVSLIPYNEIQGDTIPEPLTTIKLQEAITVIRTVDLEVDGLLNNFSEQGKIDLVDYMQRHYSFNVSIAKFANLTGRSLATFKRDFQKAFRTSPQKWLLEKRLMEAHYLITQGNKRPSEIYLEVGFENLSHFSRSFKQHFGYNPSSIEVSRIEK